MSFFTKTCSICGNNIFALGGNSLLDGCYCKHCKTRLSPLFTHQNKLTVNDIMYQLEMRQKNEKLFAQFAPTKTIGDQVKILINESNHQFVVLLPSQKNSYTTPDVISFSQLRDCSIEIEEQKNEVLYEDFRDDLKSFSPPYYAYSYDFFINISVNVPYIQTIRIKINPTTIDNDQPHVIQKTGGIGQMFKDAIGSARSYNGMTSNISEVQSSSAYKKYEKLANEMMNTLLEAKTTFLSQKVTVRCPWCGSLVIDNHNGICTHCCGQL